MSYGLVVFILTTLISTYYALEQRRDSAQLADERDRLLAELEAARRIHRLAIGKDMDELAARVLQLHQRDDHTCEFCGAYTSGAKS